MLFTVLFIRAEMLFLRSGTIYSIPSLSLAKKKSHDEDDVKKTSLTSKVLLFYLHG
jgi:hypothetical protein